MAQLSEKQEEGAGPSGSESASGRLRGTGPTLRAALGMLLLLCSSPGCSLFLTKGPEPDLKPPPECTSVVEAPVIDTILAASSVALAVVLANSASAPCPSSQSGFGSFCFNGVGWAGAAGAGVLALLFTSSAIVGYVRTSDCRASLAGTHAPPPKTPPKSSLLPSSPLDGCADTGDAPRVCPLPSKRPSWEAGAGAVGSRASFGALEGSRGNE